MTLRPLPMIALVLVLMLSGCGTRYPQVRHTDWYAEEAARVERKSKQAGRPEVGDYGHALWVGRVAKRIMRNPTGIREEFRGVWIEEADLLAGRRGIGEADGRVAIYFGGLEFHGDKPRVGEIWAFSVQREVRGVNYARSAHRVAQSAPTDGT